MKTKIVVLFIVCLTLIMYRCSDEENPTLKLSSFSPAQGIPGDLVTILGDQFSSQNTTVTFNNVPTTLVTSTQGQLEVKVPVGATTGKIAVMVNGERVESATDFKVLQPPSITSFAPINAWSGATLTIIGTNFKTTATENVVKFGDIPAQITSASSTELKVTVPANVTSSKISIVADGITVTSAIEFKPITVTVSTFAGSGSLGALDGQGIQAQFYSPSGLYIDGLDNIYVTDKDGDRVRKISPSGTVSTVAGSSSGYADGNANVAKFSKPEGITMDGMANLYVADAFNNRIRKIDLLARVVSTVAGDGTQGYLDGTNTATKLFNPLALISDSHGNLLVSDFGNHMIRKISSAGVVTTFVGTTSPGYTDGSSSQARFRYPRGLVADNAGNIYIADAGNSVIRKIDVEGQVTTVAGTGVAGFKDGKSSEAQFNNPSSLAIDANSNIYVVDALNNSIRMITATGDVVTIAGSKESGYVDGTNGQVKFFAPVFLDIDSKGNIYVSDYVNNRIRKITIEYK